MDAPRLAAALLICLCFGSIHAYGVLLEPVEHWLGVSRTVASLGYALAVAALTAGVYANGRLAAMAPARTRLLGSGIIAALGLVLAGGTSSAAGLLMGFGLLYGLANGIAYATALTLAASAMPGREPQAMGLATAAYGLGAVLCAQLFAAALASLPVAVVLLALAPAVLLVGLTGWILVPQRLTAPETMARPQPTPRPLLLLWVSYGLGAFAGLMVLAHAPAIAVWREGAAAAAGLASAAVAFGSVAGGYLGGLAGARLPGPRGVALPLLVQAAALAALPLVTGLPVLVTLMGVAGLCYGVLIAVIPAEVRRIAGPDGFAASYGKVFSAWGLAGVAGPVTAGYLYDVTLGYGAALAVAAALSVGGALVVMAAAG